MSTTVPRDRSASQLRRWFRPLARAGYAARGLIYLVIGLFAALAATGAGQTMGSRDALERLMNTGGGVAIAWLLAAALAFHALWRLVQAGFDTDDHGVDAKGLAVRGGLLVSGVTYLALTAYTISRARGVGGGDGDDGGNVARWLAAFVGTTFAGATIAAALVGAGVAHVVKALRERYARHMEASPSMMRIVHPIAKVGLIARGAVFAVAGFMLGLNALRGGGGGDPPGSAEALQYIQDLPFGALLLAATGMGLVLFAAYSFAEALLRRINVEDAV
ncbi:MAG: DUF1206 domain-containing protein [Rhizobiaceae bacterium]|nr:DUF1206 domain-containing protein [Rhizobiaceae bacterium]MCV0408582.1 DUF1206 domain-containing protein [Rhizobiaceae bacterium]